MPKKTRKEKIIAQLRRKLETTKVKDQKWEMEDEKLDDEMRGMKKEISLQDIPLPNQASQVPSLTSGYMMKDLRKTFFLAGLAISLEFIVYWLTELGGSKLFKF